MVNMQHFQIKKRASTVGNDIVAELCVNEKEYLHYYKNERKNSENRDREKCREKKIISKRCVKCPSTD